MKHVTLISMIFCAQAFGANVVGLWHMDEQMGQTAHDSSGYGNNGQLGSNMVSDPNDPTWVSGKYIEALHFNGTNNWMQVPNSNSLAVTGSITVEAWVKLDSYSSSQGIIAKWNDVSNPTGRSYALTMLGGQVRFDVSHNGTFGGGPCNPSGGISLACNGSAAVLSTAVVPLGRWSHVAGVFDSSTRKLQVFVDGSPDTSVIAQHSNIFSTSENVLIGAADFTGSRVFLAGAVDEARVWKRALSPAEVLSSAQAGLRGLWHFNNNGTDSSGYGNDVFVSGTSYTPNRKFGAGALLLDGTDDYAATGTNASLSITGPITVETWVNLNALPAAPFGFAPVAAKWNDLAGNFRSYALAVTPDGSVRFDVSHTGGFSCGSFNNFGPYSCATADSALVISNRKITLNAWTHIAGVFDGQTLQVFVNGVPDTSIGTSAANIFPVTYPVAFGFAYEGSVSAQVTSGTIDEMHIWARPLGAAEIAFEANALTAAELLMPDQMSQSGLKTTAGSPAGAVFGSTFSPRQPETAMALEFVIPDTAGAHINSVTGPVPSGLGPNLLGSVTGNNGLSALMTGKTIAPPDLPVTMNLSDMTKLAIDFTWGQ